jgi:hypothetical protein
MGSVGIVELSFMLWLLFAVIATVVGSMKGHKAGGFFLGLLLGPLGILIATVLPNKSKLDMIQTRPQQAGWFTDPLGRFDQRYFDGKKWSQQVGRRRSNSAL